MDETSWWTAAQAKENGFIDELTDEADGAVIENRDGLLFVNSVNTHLPFDKAPNFVQSSKAAPASCSVNNNCHKEVTNMANEIKTVDALRGPIPHWSMKSRRRRRTKRRATSASASTTSRTWPCPAARR